MPLPDGGANIGIGTLAPAAATTEAAHLRDLFDRFVSGTPWLAGATIADDLPPRAWPLALAPRRGPLVGDGVLLVGEAAALVGPMTGAGIYPAMRSGVWAAETLIAALRTGDLSRRALLPYERRVHRRFLPQHRVEAWAQRLLTNPTRLRHITNALRPLPFTAPLGASLLLHLG
jgi:flavin-dependent dehydrogenase